MKPPLDKRLADPIADQVRRSHANEIMKLQLLPSASLRVIPNVELVDGVAKQVSHGLGRRPLAWWPTPPRGAASTGRIDDLRSELPSGAPNDVARTIALVANGYGATVIVDLVVL